MKRAAVFALSLTLSGFVSFAQLSEGTKVGVATGKGLNVPSSGVFWSSPTDASNVVGKFYADSLWHEGTVEVKKEIPQFVGWESNQLASMMIRYNVLNDELEVLANRAKNDIRVIRGNYLVGFAIKESENDSVKFVRAGNFESENVLKGFFEILSSGKLTLAKHDRAKIIKPNYNPGFGVGEKNTVVNIASDYYVLSGEKAEKINPGKKALLTLMKDREKDIEAFIKSEKTDFKDEESLAALFKYYNK